MRNSYKQQNNSNNEPPVVKRKTFTISIIITIFFIFLMFLLYQNQQSQNKAAQDKIINLQDKNNNLNSYIVKLKSGKIKDFSASNLIQSSQDSKYNIQSFFSAIYNWNGSNYSDKYKNALKYGTEKATHTMLGDSSNYDASSNKSFISNAIKNNIGQNVEDSHIFMEQSDGSLINGIYSVKVRTNSNSKHTYSMQWFRFHYNVQSKKVTDVASVETDNSSTKAKDY